MGVNARDAPVFGNGLYDQHQRAHGRDGPGDVGPVVDLTVVAEGYEEKHPESVHVGQRVGNALMEEFAVGFGGPVRALDLEDDGGVAAGRDHTSGPGLRRQPELAQRLVAGDDADAVFADLGAGGRTVRRERTPCTGERRQASRGQSTAVAQAFGDEDGRTRHLEPYRSAGTLELLKVRHPVLPSAREKGARSSRSR